MGELLTKIFAVFAIIVFITMLCNHGAIDFSLWDKVTETTTDAIQSDEGQALIAETEQTSFDVAKTFLGYFSSSARKARENAEAHQKQGIMEEVAVVKVVDGDTLIVKMENGNEVYVRLIGIDTPESVNPDESLNNSFGNMSSEHTKEIMADISTVWLQRDKGLKDKYGRELAYVWISKDVDLSSMQDVANYMLNGRIIREGYAIDKQISPNTMYADMFAELREDAQNSRAGLWNEEGIDNIWQ